MAGLFFEEFQPGTKFTTPARTVTEADIVRFASISGDYNPLHTDEETARRTPFGGRIAHGALTFAISTGLTDRLGVLQGTALGLVGIRDLRFPRAVKPGDTLHVEVEVVSAEPKKGGRGLVNLRRVVKNQRGEEVMRGDFILLVKSRGG
ncbi:MAG: MaoC family dehydratase N-terminal domain-containing protein [Euryarchaeota archaeon]|nr:MaoC family dehydratase N-terminal domain-containing protein [Euryarchaeota archaeon]